MTPDDYTNKEFFIDVGHGHQLYVHDWGNPKGLPIMHLHGGPGNGCSDRAKGNFDPHQQRVIFFDQRGAGKSLPYGSLAHNTTADLVEDIEKIAKHLDLKRFVIHGCSWGAALALAYSLKYPKRVQAMVLQGIWTGARAENEWLTKGGFRATFPDAWDTYVQSVPAKHRDDPSAYHFARALDKDVQAARQSVAAYLNLERSIAKIDDRAELVDPADPAFDPASALIEMTYVLNDCFMPDRYIMDNAHKLTMPIWLVQGRYDMLCAPQAAYELDQKLPNSQLLWTVGGHLASERESHSLVRAILLQLARKT